MSAVRPLVAEVVQVGSGEGLLARRDDGVLFVDDGAIASRPAMITAFNDAADGMAALDDVLRVAADEELQVGAFVIVVWRPSIHVVVFGDLVLETDLPSLPRLAGSGVGTWVEHRAPRAAQRCEVRLGGATVPGTDLTAGTVPAGGFRIVLAAGAAVAPVAPQRATPPASVVDDATPAPPAAAPSSPIPPDPHPARAPRPVPAASWDVLRDAGGGWMEESLQISDGVRAARESADAAAPSHQPTPARQPAPPSPTRPAVAADPTTPTARADAPEFDPEVTLDPRALATAPPAPSAPPLPATPARMVQARRCDLGHLNPPLRTECRTCAHYIPPATPVETVPQPVLATLLLPDGRALDVAGSVVIGRQPSVDAARLDEPGELVVVEGDPSVSRTHVVVGVDGWTLLATDCAATAGTAIAPSGADPVLLEAWVPHEIGPGSTLFLGGRTHVRVVAPR